MADERDVLDHDGGDRSIPRDAKQTKAREHARGVDRADHDPDAAQERAAETKGPDARRDAVSETE
ncbi:MAG TPA: hypothetical protein VFT96_02025 [Gemmatimonadaceae bacterium]|nr:hypothetical protein [Gemmatimonadaceae bacterium]